MRLQIDKVLNKSNENHLKIPTLSNGLNATKAKCSNLEMKQMFLEKKISENFSMFKKAEQTSGIKITKFSTQLAHLNDMRTSMQNQTSNNKCQSGIVVSPYIFKTADKTVSFKEPFQSKPNIVFGLSLYDAYHHVDDRLKAYPTKLDKYGFTLKNIDLGF
ncbi:uncharacterized protein LOC134262865 [Saccostrea cucullata]|uniref:uncharacterized protein LOC134262865 n=1 Tax=Saccostrea cuccullata TaxID=36930 RepID=UPI002ED6261B